MPQGLSCQQRQQESSQQLAQESVGTYNRNLQYGWISEKSIIPCEIYSPPDGALVTGRGYRQKVREQHQ
jgi:hypothetical protein